MKKLIIFDLDNTFYDYEKVTTMHCWLCSIIKNIFLNSMTF